MKPGPPTEVGGPGFMRWPAFYKAYRCIVDDMISGIAVGTFILDGICRYIRLNKSFIY